jgi:hypothetical protein
VALIGARGNRSLTVAALIGARGNHSLTIVALIGARGNRSLTVAALIGGPGDHSLTVVALIGAARVSKRLFGGTESRGHGTRNENARRAPVLVKQDLFSVRLNGFWAARVDIRPEEA